MAKGLGAPEGANPLCKAPPHLVADGFEAKRGCETSPNSKGRCSDAPSSIPGSFPQKPCTLCRIQAQKGFSPPPPLEHTGCKCVTPATPGSRQQEPRSPGQHAAPCHGAGTSPLQLEGCSTIPRAKTKPRLIKSSRGEQGRAISRASLLGKQKSLHHNGSSSLRRDNPIYTAGTSPSVTSPAQMPPLGFFSPFRAYGEHSEGRKCFERKILRGCCSKLHVPGDAPCSQARECSAVRRALSKVPARGGIASSLGLLGADAGVFPPGTCRVLGGVGLYWFALVVLGAPCLQQMRKGSSEDDPCTPRATSPGPRRPPGHQTQVWEGAWSPFSSHSISSEGPRSQQVPTTPFPCPQHHIGALKALEIFRITAPAGGFFQVRTPS